MDVTAEIIMQRDLCLFCLAYQEMGNGNPVEIILKICILCRVVGISVVVVLPGIESAGRLPPVGHAVTVGIESGLPLAGLDVQSTEAFATLVFLRVDDSVLLRPRAKSRGRTFCRLRDLSLIHI